MDGTGSWLGDGVLDGILRFDSFQLSYDDDHVSHQTGDIYLDDLRLVKKVPVNIDIKSEFILPTSIVLKQNYPNPFNPVTTIEFGLPTAGRVRMELFDINGKNCGIILDTYKSAGYHRVEVDGSGLSSGTYIYTINALNTLLQKKMFLVK